MHIDNLYKERDILLFKECCAMEKIHGTSAHVSWNKEQLHFFNGGSNYMSFVKLFDHAALEIAFRELGY
jgi:hypothetical protein